MFHGKHRDWQGNLTPKIFTKTIKKYPRELIPVPSQTLEIIAIKNKLFVSTSEIDLNSGDKILNLHIINLMLECFNEFEIFDVDLADIVSLKIRRLQWDILPPGEYPWEISRNLIYKITDQPNFIDKEVIEHRMKMISKRDPDFLAVGKAGFNGYFVYGFIKKDIYIFESVHLDNATYIFNSNWKDISTLSKNQIINSDISHKRIIHNKKWSIEVGRAIGN